MFKCKCDDGVTREVEPLYVKNGLVPVITICVQKMLPTFGKPEPSHPVPNVTGLELSADGLSVDVTWTPNNLFYTEVQYRTNGGEWQTLLVDPGVGTISSGDS